MSNESGIRPLDLKVLLLPEAPKEKIGSIILADQTKDKEKFAGVRALLLDKGPNAFREWGEGAAPELGSTVMIAQYAGLRQKGADGLEYTIANDSDVIAVLEAAQ